MTPLLLSAWRSGTRAAGLVVPHRFLAPSPAPTRSASVLVHAASAGEVAAAHSLRDVSRRHSTADWLITTGTAAGVTMGAEARMCRDVPRLLATVFDVVRPKALLLVEAELWPNLLLEAEARGVPVGVIGATMSASTSLRFAGHPAAAGRLLASVRGFAAASADDADRLVVAGASPQAVKVTGWIKWPAASRVALDQASSMILDEVGDTGPLVVLGSVHPGEVTLAAQRLAGTSVAPERARWVICPRHARAQAAIRAECARELPHGSAWRLDERFGVLRQWFGASDHVVIGGGGTGKGTHNLLEPLAAGRCPLFFPDRGERASWDQLASHGLATRLGPTRPASEPPRAPSEPWHQTLARWDGRESGLRFLTEQGVSLT